MNSALSIERLAIVGVIAATLLLSLASFVLLRNVYWGDPSIYLIYARNIAQGHWFEFNRNEFSSGATSPLWAVLLALGFLFGDGIDLARGMGAVATLVALISTWWTLRKATHSSAWGVLGMGVVAYFLLLPGLMMYETSLIVILINLAIAFSDADHKLLLAAVWGLIPLTRPEWTVFVFLHLLWMIVTRRLPVTVGMIGFLAAMIPAALYFGHSYLLTGLLSASSVCRSYALRETFSISNWQEYMRYALPILPLLLLPVGQWLQRRRVLNGTLIVLLLSTASLSLVFAAYPPILGNSARPLSFDVIVEKNAMEMINSLAEQGDTILVYEVQDRFYLREDLHLLALDGITDGKIAPYFGDVTGFLKRYRPDYWLANDAVQYRPYLAHSLLRRVAQEAATVGDQVSVDGIRFTNLWDSPPGGDPNFASATHLYRIDYDPD